MGPRVGCPSTYALGIVALAFASAQEASLVFGTNDGEEVCEQQRREDREFPRFSLQVNKTYHLFLCFWVRQVYCYRMFYDFLYAVPWQRLQRVYSMRFFLVQLRLLFSIHHVHRKLTTPIFVVLCSPVADCFSWGS